MPPLPDDEDGTTTTPVLHGARSYGVAPRVQLLLSEVRTDLDSFSEVEAHALAAYGYAMSAIELEVDGIRELGSEGVTNGTWAFSARRRLHGAAAEGVRPPARDWRRSGS